MTMFVTEVESTLCIECSVIVCVAKVGVGLYNDCSMTVFVTETGWSVILPVTEIGPGLYADCLTTVCI